MLDLYISFQKDRYFNLQFYEDLIVELISDMKKHCHPSLMVKPTMIYLKLLKELCKELFYTVDEHDRDRLFIFSRKVIR